MSVKVYVAAACETNYQGKARAGYGVYWGLAHHLNVSDPLQENPTLDRARIHAIIRALTDAHRNGISSLQIYTDTVNDWLLIWIEAHGMVAVHEPDDGVTEEDFAQLNDVLMKMVDIEWFLAEGDEKFNAAMVLAERGMDNCAWWST